MITSFRPSTIISSALDEIVSLLTLSNPVDEKPRPSFRVFQRQRAVQGRDILLKRVEEAHIDEDLTVKYDELLAILYAFIQLAVNGAASVNLDLLSQSISGELKRKKLDYNIYLKYSNIFASLTREEIIVVCAYFESLETARSEAQVKHEIFLGGLVNFTWQTFRDLLVPKTFSSEEHLKVLMGGLIRTGLVKAITSTIDDVGVPQFTFLLDDVGAVVNFRGALDHFPNF